jgi:DNA replication protein DnaC
MQTQTNKLRRLSDTEYSEVEAKASMSGIGLSTCPTCKSKFEEVEPGVKVWPDVCTYKYKGEEFDCDCKTQMALRRHYLLAGIPDQYMRLDWNDFIGSQDIVDAVNSYVVNWENLKDNGLGLEFGGKGLGIGKTFAATHIGKEMIKRGQRVLFMPFVEMISAFNKPNADELENRLRETTFLVLDEILPPVSERQADLFSTRYEAIIRHRTNYNLPTIITTNLTEDELYDKYARTYSLLAAKQIRIDMGGEDARVSRIGNENFEMALNGEVRPLT